MSVKTARSEALDATIEQKPQASVTLGFIVGYPAVEGDGQLRMTSGGKNGTILQIQGGPVITLSDDSVTALRRDLLKATK